MKRVCWYSLPLIAATECWITARDGVAEGRITETALYLQSFVTIHMAENIVILSEDLMFIEGLTRGSN